MKSVTPFLLFVGDQAGKAEEAISFYTSLFDNSEVIDIERHGAGGDETEGSVLQARFTLNGVEIRAMDSALNHQFTFTPAVSLFVECESIEEIDNAYDKFISGGGDALMPIDNYGFSKRFAWIQDTYCVSWQLNLPD